MREGGNLLKSEGRCRIKRCSRIQNKYLFDVLRILLFFELISKNNLILTPFRLKPYFYILRLNKYSSCSNNNSKDVMNTYM